LCPEPEVVTVVAARRSSSLMCVPADIGQMVIHHDGA
jgi:hypothetical protein